MITLEVYILTVRENIQTLFTTLYRKVDNGSDCFSDKLKYIIANVYLDILSTESVFTSLSADRQETIVNCLNKLFNLKKSIDLDNLVYTDLIKNNEGYPSIIL